MKKVPISMIVSMVFLSLSLMAAGQGVSNDLNDQMLQAASKGDTTAVQQLLQEGANIEAKDNGETALMRALSHGHPEVGKLLIDKGAQIEYMAPPVLGAQPVGYSALSYAAGNCQAEIVKRSALGGSRLMRNGLSTEGTGREGVADQTPICRVAVERR